MGTSSSQQPRQRWDGGAASVAGSQKSVQAEFSGEAGGSRHSVGCLSSWSLCRHSTKKRSSTTSRTAKRTAMAHHWRRSRRQDTRVSAQVSTFPRQSHEN